MDSSVARPRLVVLPDPLLGPAVWWPVAAALTDRGWDATVAPHLAGPPCCAAEVLTALSAAVPTEAEVVLVAHGHAALYVPALVVNRADVRVVYVDGDLPGSLTVRSRLASEEDVRGLARLADDDGVLPRWLDWWTATEQAELMPDPAMRAALVTEQQCFPLGYFAGTITVPAGWRATPAAYLGFGDRPGEDQVRAARWGWTTRTLPGGPLLPATSAELVAETVDELAPAATASHNLT